MSELKITYTQRRKTQKPLQGQQVSRPRKKSETSHKISRHAKGLPLTFNTLYFVHAVMIQNSTTFTEETYRKRYIDSFKCQKYLQTPEWSSIILPKTYKFSTFYFRN